MSDSTAGDHEGEIEEGVAGVVVGADESPVAGAFIQVVAVGHSGPAPDMAVISGPDGRFVWRLRPGRYRLDAIVDGRVLASAATQVAHGAVTRIRLKAPAK